ncbi:hypothetical protein JOY44_24435 [Phormidium sp. CLA17]|uniref:hypothetical protein n=1 Tax=Leptolyngbya sp. Cla-17 TaxID=2803751 RepID=UPI00149171D2|nr:hypothetical protein [Leptolyngbya sp. Cla-17]MBM0744714.1 hypothetical protein [Leptolyngbya sp. Cla-17]
MLVEIKNDNPVLDVLGDDYETAIVVKDQPLATFFYDCEGSLGQYLVRSSVESISSMLAEYRLATQFAENQTAALAVIVSTYEKLLASGTYRVGRYSIAESSTYFEYGNDWKVESDSDWEYPDPPWKVVALQSKDQLNTNTIDEYKQIIKSGRSPLCITLSAQGFEEVEYLIDGHHKIAAYRSLAIPAQAIGFTKQNCSNLVKEPLKDFVPKQHRLHRSYIRNKIAFT